MGNKGSKSSSNSKFDSDGADGNSTMTRAIARGRVYVIISYPGSVLTLEKTAFNDAQFRDLLMALQEVCGYGIWWAKKFLVDLCMFWPMFVFSLTS